MPQEVTYGALAGAMLLTCFTRFRPLLAIQRGVIYARAVVAVLPSGARAAMRAMSDDWPFVVAEIRRQG